MSWYLDYIIRAKNEASGPTKEALADLEKLTRETEENQKASQRWTAQQQRAAMAMSGLHDQALKMNAALNNTSGMEKMSAAFTSLTSGGGVSGALSAIGPAGVAAAAGFTAVSGAVVVAAREVMKLTSQAEGWTNMAKSTGLGVVEVQQLSDLLEDAGIPADALKVAMKNLSDEVATGGKELAQFGVEIKGWDLMTQEERLRAMAQVIADVEDPATKSKLAVAAFGRSGADLIPVMEDIAGGAYKMYDALGGAQVAQLAAADAKIDQFTRKLTNLRKTFTAWAIDLVQGMRMVNGIPMWLPNADAIAEGAAGAAPDKKPPSQAEQDRQERERKARAAKAGGDSKKKVTNWLIPNAVQFADMQRELDAMLAKYEQDKLKETERFEKLKADAMLRARKGAMKQLQEIDEQIANDNLQKLKSHKFEIVENLGSSLKTALGKLPEVVLGALQGGGSVTKAVGSLFGTALGEGIQSSVTKALGFLGKTLSGALGSILPGIGSVLGSAVGGLFSKLFGGDKYKKEVTQLRNDFIQASGGMEALRRRAEAAGVSLKRFLTNTRDVAQMRSEIEALQRAFELHDEATQKLNEAVERYGLSIDELGPRWAQQRLDEQAAQLIQDYRLLEQAGADMNAVIAKMGPNINEYVEASLRAGTAIPEAMRPIIQALYEQGKLVHENGEAYTEAEYQALHYSQTMTQQFQTLIDKIDALVSALLGIPSEINTTVNVNENRNRPRPSDEQGDEGGSLPEGGSVPPMARGGVVLPFVPRAANGLYAPQRPGGMLARIGEGGKDELVLPVQAVLENAVRIGAAAAAGGDVYVFIDGQQLDARIERRTRTGHTRVDAAGVRRRG